MIQGFYLSIDDLKVFQTEIAFTFLAQIPALYNIQGSRKWAVRIPVKMPQLLVKDFICTRTESVLASWWDWKNNCRGRKGPRGVAAFIPPP